MSGNSASGTERPNGWPEMYSAAGRGPGCPHQMHWDSGDGVYRCVHMCGEVDEEPPERYIDTGKQQNGGDS